MIISPEPFDLDRATPGVATIQYLSDELSSLRVYTDRLIVAADRREDQIAEAWDEVERLRGVIERLQIEKHDLAERLMRTGSKPT
jgi:hypothetical protein